MTAAATAYQDALDADSSYAKAESAWLGGGSA